MKKYIYIIAAYFAVAISCENSNENLVQERGVAVVPEMSEAIPAYFTDNIEASYVQFNVALSKDDRIDKAEIEVVRVRGNKSAIVKEIQLPVTDLRVTATEVLAALNIPTNDYLLGDVFNLYILTTKNGKTTRSIASVGIPVVCYFDLSMLVGNFYYISEDWDEEGDVVLEADPNDPYKIYIRGMAETQGLEGTGNRLELNLNPNNFGITGPRVVISNDLSPWGLPYTAYAYAPVSGKFDTCEQVYIITFNITVSAGDYGDYEFIFTKK